jgi:uncharacterized phage-like protein YoqJ
MGKMRNASRILVRKPERKIPLERHKRRWKANIRMDLRDRVKVVDWIYLIEDRDQWLALANTIMNLRVP